MARWGKGTKHTKGKPRASSVTILDALNPTIYPQAHIIVKPTTPPSLTRSERKTSAHLAHKVEILGGRIEEILVSAAQEDELSRRRRPL